MNHIYSRIPEGLTPAQRAATERDLSRVACTMVHWFADRAFTCPDSLEDTVETYRGLVLQNVHQAIPGDE